MYIGRMDERLILSLLRQKQGEMSQSDLAKQIGVSAAYLSDVYRGNRRPADKILKFLGITKTVVYKRAKRNQ